MVGVAPGGGPVRGDFGVAERLGHVSGCVDHLSGVYVCCVRSSLVCVLADLEDWKKQLKSLFSVWYD